MSPYDEDDDGPLWTLEHHDEVTSTNAVAKARAKADAPDRTVIIASTQTEGRGRGAHTWSSPEGGLYASFLVRQLPARYLDLLPLAAGVATIRALGDLAPRDDLLIKWPNDILADQEGTLRKVGGILVEGSATGEHLDYAIIGIGLNLATPPEMLPEDTDPPAGTLLERFLDDISDEIHVDHHDVIDELLERMDEALDLLDEAPDQLVLAANSHLAYKGQRVTVTTDDGPVTGTLASIDEAGRLLLGTPDGQRVIDAWNAQGIRPA